MSKPALPLLRTTLPRSLLLALACGTTSIGGASCAPAGVDTITLDGKTREYRFHIPTGLSGTAPLLVVLHGGGGNGQQIQRLTRFDEMADREGFFALFPSAYKGHWNDGRVGDELTANAEGVDDVELIDEILDRLIVRYPIDQSRIYVTGPSNGGIFALRLACSELGVRLAAVAPVIGAFAEGGMEDCQARPLPVQLMNGSDDELVPPAGGEVSTGGRGRVESLDDTTAFWVEHNGCTGEPLHEDVDALADDETALAIDTWSPCERATEVKRILIEGGGHMWPGGTNNAELLEGFLGKSSAELDASEAVWAFVSRFERR